MKKFVLTISRQFGCGAHETGTKLAEKLGIKYYDKELIARSAKDYGFDENVIAHYDEKPTKSFLYSIVTEGFPIAMSNQMPIDERIFQFTSETIQKVADESSCIIVGRCSDYILKGRDDLVTVFLHADLDYRIKRVTEIYGVSEKESKDKIVKTDKKRAQFHNFRSPDKWGSGDLYDLNIDMTKLGVDKTVDLICEYLKIRGFID